MKIQNVNSQDNNGYYAVQVICKNETESDRVWDNLSKEGFLLDFGGDDDTIIDVMIGDHEHDLKSEFLAAVRKIAKKK